VITELQQLGLSYYEAKALVVLFSERFTLKELSKKAKIPYGKIYSVTKALAARGYLEQSATRPKLISARNASDIMMALIKQKQSSTETLFQQVREHATLLDKQEKRSTKFFEIGSTLEDNKRIQLRIFQESQKEILQILNNYHKPKSNRESKGVWEEAIVAAVHRGVRIKALYPVSTVLPTILEKLHQQHPDKFQVRRFDTFFSRCDIADGNKVLIKIVYDDPIHFGGVIYVEHEQLARNLTAIFHRFWKEAEPH